uniref:Uncharacterized protein n=1 Tax=Angiostrongylus cantonensis TaxID=6313 RepID=A0A0K0CWV6_ANGCA
MLAPKRQRLPKPVLIHISSIVNGRFGLLVVRMNVDGQTRVDENADAADSCTVACCEEQFCGVIEAIECVASLYLGQADDVVPYPSWLHERVFY